MYEPGCRKSGVQQECLHLLSNGDMQEKWADGKPQTSLWWCVWILIMHSEASLSSRWLTPHPFNVVEQKLCQNGIKINEIHFMPQENEHILISLVYLVYGKPQVRVIRVIRVQKGLENSPWCLPPALRWIPGVISQELFHHLLHPPPMQLWLVVPEALNTFRVLIGMWVPALDWFLPFSEVLGVFFYLPVIVEILSNRRLDPSDRCFSATKAWYTLKDDLHVTRRASAGWTSVYLD